MSCAPNATLTYFGLTYATWNEPRCLGTCGRNFPTNDEFAAPPSVTLALSYTYAPLNRHEVPRRYSTSVCRPQMRVLPRFCRCCVTFAPTCDSVTFETGFFTRLSNQVVRQDRLRTG